MADSLAKFHVVGKNKILVKEIEKLLAYDNFQIEKHRTDKTDYEILIYEIDREVEEFSATILNELASLKGFAGKSVVVFACSSSTNPDFVERATSLIRPMLGSYENNIRLVIAYDLYSPDSAPLSAFHQWLFESVAKESISVSGTEGNHLTPTSVADLTRLLIKSLFVTNTSGEIFTAAAEDLTDLEIAYQLKKSLEKKGSSLDIDLAAKTISPSSLPYDLSVQTQALLNWIPKTSLLDSLDQIVERARVGQVGSLDQKEVKVIPLAESPKLEKIHFEPETKPKPSGPSIFSRLRGKLYRRKERGTLSGPSLHQLERRKISKVFFVILVLIFVLFLIPVLLVIGSLYLSASKTYASYQSARGGDLPSARANLKKALTYKRIAEVSFRSVSTVSEPVARSVTVDTNNFLLTLGHVQDVLGNVLDTYGVADQLYQSLFGKQAADQEALISALKVNLIALSEKLSQIQLLISDVRLPFGYDQKINKDEVTGQINLLKSQIGSSLPLLDLAGGVLENKSTQRYLVLVQDNNELRPGGGFLSTYALITLDQGRIIGIQADSALSFDRLIEGKIEPPKVLKQLTGQTNWSFHDSNLDPDWSVNARQASWFYQRFKGQSVDGVIGLTLNVYRLLLEQIGEVKLPEDKVVNSENINLLASNPTNDKGFDVSTLLTQVLSQKLLNGEVKFVHLARTLIKAAAHDEIAFWFEKPTLEALAEEANIAGRVMPQSCHPQLSAYRCAADTIYLNEANFSVSKINFYLKRQDTYESQISESGEVTHTLTFDYTYPVPAPTNFSQFYNSYYQFYLPDAARNLKIVLDGQILPESSLIKTNQANGLARVDFSANQSINQPHRLVISFTSAFQINLRAPNIPFTLAVLKQPGTMNGSQIIRLKYPASLLPRVLTLPLKQSGANELVLQVSPISRENIGVLFKNQAL